MTKDRFIENWIGGTIFPENMNRDLDLLIQQAIADHDAAQWKSYPENKPELGNYLITTNNGTVEKARYNTFYWVMLGGKSIIPIAFRELPAPFQEGGEG